MSEAGTGFFYTTRKNPARTPHKLQFVKYDPARRRRVMTQLSGSLRQASAANLAAAALPGAACRSLLQNGSVVTQQCWSRAVALIAHLITKSARSRSGPARALGVPPPLETRAGKACMRRGMKP